MPSTVIRGIHYNPDTEVLQITFVSGSVYAYYKVPPAVAAGMQQSRSKGSYLNQHILHQYRFRKLSG